MQVGKEANLNHAVGVLLHPDPQEGAYVADKPRGAWGVEKITVRVTEERYCYHRVKCDVRLKIDVRHCL